MHLIVWVAMVAGYMLAVVGMVEATRFERVSIDPLTASLILIGGSLTVALTAQAVRSRSPGVRDEHNGHRPHG